MHHFLRYPILPPLIIFLLQITGCTTLSSNHAPTYIEPSTNMEFLFVAGGNFVMGDSAGKGHMREQPPRKVTIAPLAVGKYEVTFEQYDKFCKATNNIKPNDQGWGRGTRPVINVSWNDAMAFSVWLSEQSGQRFTLPSEAQWEYFSRTSRNNWASKNPEQNQANCDGCGSPWNRIGTAPVGTFPPNPQGLYDTAGNVNEWCLDTMHPNYVGAPVDGRAWIDKNVKEHVHRGGNWTSPPDDLDPYVRDFADAKFKGAYIGFRLVMENLATNK